MLKKLVALLAIVSLTLTPISPVNAAVKAGAACPKAGNTAIASGKSFTCIKSGKKLIWDKGVAIPKSATSPKTPELPPMPQDFQNLASNLEGIKYWAWKKVNLEIEKNNSVLGQVEIFTGPNSVPTQANSIDKLIIGSKLFSNFSQVKKIYIIQFEYQDIDWAQNQYSKFQDSSTMFDPKKAAASQCPDERCRNASIELNSHIEAVMLVGTVPLKNQVADKIENPGRYNGTQQIHEYVHSIQLLNSANSESRFNYGLLPRWMLEGQALWSAQAAVANSYDEYLALRNIDYPELREMRPSYSAEWIEEFLNPNPVFNKNTDTWLYWQKYPNYRVYDIGGLANEILTSIKGPSAVMNLYAAVGKGSTFLYAFKQEFGINWNEAVTYISKAIAAELDRMSKS